MRAVDEGEQLVAACLDEEDGDPFPLLVYADWLDDRGAAGHARLARAVAESEWRAKSPGHLCLRHQGATLIDLYDYGRRVLWVTVGRRSGKAPGPLSARRAALAHLLHHVGFLCVCGLWEDSML